MVSRTVMATDRPGTVTPISTTMSIAMTRTSRRSASRSMSRSAAMRSIAGLEVLLLFRGADFLRTKGIINVVDHDGPVVIHGVQHIFHPAVILKEWPSEDRRSRIVFITRNIDESVIRDTLGMFTDAEAQRPELLPAESGDSDIAVFEVPR